MWGGAISQAAAALSRRVARPRVGRRRRAAGCAECSACPKASVGDQKIRVSQNPCTNTEQLHKPPWHACRSPARWRGCADYMLTRDRAPAAVLGLWWSAPATHNRPSSNSPPTSPKSQSHAAGRSRAARLATRFARLCRSTPHGRVVSRWAVQLSTPGVVHLLGSWRGRQYVLAAQSHRKGQNLITITENKIHYLSTQTLCPLAHG